MAGFEILEHTADVGVRAHGDTVEQAFAAAAQGMAEIAGVWQPNGGDPVAVSVEASDREALLADWLGEVLYLQDARTAAITAVDVEHVTDTRAQSVVRLKPFAGDPSEGVQIKAVTYHQLVVRHSNGEWEVQAFFDV